MEGNPNITLTHLESRNLVSFDRNWLLSFREITFHNAGETGINILIAENPELKID